VRENFASRKPLFGTRRYESLVPSNVATYIRKLIRVIFQKVFSRESRACFTKAFRRKISS
jgi:hypothetical protein